MGRDAGYVYYEADSAMCFLNPFVPTDVDNPTLAAYQQKPLKVNIPSQKFFIIYHMFNQIVMRFWKALSEVHKPFSDQILSYPSVSETNYFGLHNHKVELVLCILLLLRVYLEKLLKISKKLRLNLAT